MKKTLYTILSIGILLLSVILILPVTVTSVVTVVLGGVVKGNDAFVHADHIHRHTDAALLVCEQGVQQVLRRAEVVLHCRLGPL